MMRASAVLPPPSVLAALAQQDDCGVGAELVAILPPLILWRERRRKRRARRA